ncbi:hypothetical protein EDD15DRAFT_2197288 [Pisolithus albus]|nr:hypothetical protein EDD15DRAFT_2197288 [Pisolithus albus]
MAALENLQGLLECWRIPSSSQEYLGSEHLLGPLRGLTEVAECGPRMVHSHVMVGMDYDVSARHHSQNHCPQPPSPTYLEDSGNNERHLPKKSRPNVASHVQSRLHSTDDYSGDSSDLIKHKRSMAMILFNDTQTFHSEIKKTATRIVPFKYGLYPPKNIDDNAK